MDRSDARAGEHRDRRLGDHAHIDGDGIPLANIEREKNVRELHHLQMKLPVCQRPDLPWLPLPDDRRLGPAPPVDMPVQSIVAQVRPATDEPFDRGSAAGDQLLPGAEPDKLVSDLPPETFGIFLG